MANINRDDAPQSNKSFQFSIWKRLGPFIKPYRWLLLLIIVTNIIISIVDVLLPLFQRYAVDNFIEQKSLQGFQTFIVGYLAVIVLQVLSFVFYTLSAMKMEMRMGRDLKRACFVHLQTLSFSYYNVTPVGYILARVMSDTNKIASITAWDLIDILWALTYVVCAFISMAMLDLRLALMVMVIVPVIAVQPNIERVMGLLDQKPNIVDSPEVIAKYGDTFHPKKENWEPIKGDIEFDDVSFQYPDGEEEVLSHFSLKIPAGTTVAIVGETGAGKSTLVNLACRFFEPTAGRILIDGRDYREHSQLWLHSRLGYVLQNPHLFSGTVMDNIRYGRLDATDEEVRAAAKAVSADTVVEHLEDGYNSDVGEGGDKLSTGEKQLISFARAVLADPAIFVLDEATSSIDTQTEQLIQSATLRLLKGRTSFLIAHRLSTIRQADLILVVKDGKIVEQGKHEELLQKGGYYHDLYSKQFQQEEMHSRLSGESA